MPKIQPVDDALRALADPGRRRILTLVRSEERMAGEIAAELPVTWPAVSQHLRVLKGAGLIAERRAGTRRYYRARPEGLAGVRAFLDGFRDEKPQPRKQGIQRG